MITTVSNIEKRLQQLCQNIWINTYKVKPNQQPQQISKFKYQIEIKLNPNSIILQRLKTNQHQAYTSSPVITLAFDIQKEPLFKYLDIKFNPKLNSNTIFTDYIDRKYRKIILQPYQVTNLQTWYQSILKFNLIITHKELRTM